MADMGRRAFKELALKVFEAAEVMTPADAADGEESGFTSYVRELEEALDEIAADETDENVLDALGKLREAVSEMETVGAAAEDVLVDLDDVAMGDFALEIEEAIDMIMMGAAAGEASALEVDHARAVVEDFTRQLTDALDEMAVTGAAAYHAVLGAGDVEKYQADGEGIEESGFTSYARELEEALDEIAADETDENVLDALGKLREAVGEMEMVGAAAEDVLVDLDDVAKGDFAVEIEECIDMIMMGVAVGEASAVEVGHARTVVEDLTRQLTEVLDEMAATTGAAADHAVLVAGDVEEEDHAVDGEVFLDDQTQQQQEMYEEALLDELDYQEMVFAIDEALDELRQEAAGCSADPPRTGFLGRCGFVTPEDLFS